MEAVAEGYDAVLARSEGRQLGGVLVRLGAAVVQEKGIVLIAADLADAARQLLLQGVAHAVGVEADLVQLLLQRFHIVGMGVADGNHGVAAVEVEIFLPLVVPDGAAFRLHRRDVEEGIYVEEFHIFLKC